eukprot:gnl/MRDRNA2_/MRDRNA2_87225_c0_seq1.p1 gnl/MRDRNA2_/MRDRNA2_87225_c0~~gnl/MRDRNA2_/MRDRNA2_87225_c0_seq1.p1  ORF type:complete len:477 (+),score=182.65 gnl/MRDRNA2_/MRDRNA2_87225_c0_seq1:138-1568(+)
MAHMRQWVENKVQKERHIEARTMGITSMLKEHGVLAGHGKSELRVEGLRRERAQEEERREFFTDYMYIKQAQDKERRAQISEMEARLASEIEQRKAQQVREDMDKKRICDSSEELRALKEKLHAAKVNKERAVQLLEQQVRLEEEKSRDTKIAEVLELERLEHMELERKLEIEKAKQRERVKRINQEQIAQKEALRQEAFDEYVKERDQVQEVVDAINREDEMEAAARRQKQLETREMLRQFAIENEQRRQETDAREREENDKIEEYARMKREHEERLAAEKEALEEEKRRVLGEMIGKQMAANKEAEELDQLRNDLHFQELEAEHRRREELQVRKKLEDRVEMMRAYESQMQLKEEKKKMDREEEEKFRAQLMAKFAEDDRIEQLNDQKRRMKIQTHKREVERLIKEKQLMYEAEREAEVEEQQKGREEEARRHTIVELERQRLLREHAGDLQDFFPKGVLEHESDKALLQTPAH